MATIATAQPTAAELAQTLAQLKERRQTLQSDLNTTIAEHTQARAALVQGTPEAVDKVTNLHARSLALVEALDAVDGQLVALQAAHDATRRDELRTQRARELLPLAATAQEHCAALIRLREEANVALQAFVTNCLAEHDALLACREELTALTAAWGYIARGDVDAVLAEAEGYGADLAALRAQWRGSASTSIDNTQNATMPPAPEPYGAVAYRLYGAAVQQRAQER
jgi:prefoldin subunit 5